MVIFNSYVSLPENILRIWMNLIMTSRDVIKMMVHSWPHFSALFIVIQPNIIQNLQVYS